jgi:hypothetical protein
MSADEQSARPPARALAIILSAVVLAIWIWG